MGKQIIFMKKSLKFISKEVVLVGGRGHTLLVKLLCMCLKLNEFQTLIGKVPYKVSFLWWGHIVTRNLSSRQRKVIRKKISNGLIPNVNVIKADGMRFGFAIVQVQELWNMLSSYQIDFGSYLIKNSLSG